jgi:hypothetical protein
MPAQIPRPAELRGNMVMTRGMGLRVAVLAIATAVAIPAFGQTAIKIHDVLRSPAVYNEHDIAVFGHVRELAFGPHYTTFKICSAHCLNVLVWGHPRISEHQALSVRGRFHILKEIDHQKWHNLIEVEHGTL